MNSQCLEFERQHGRRLGLHFSWSLHCYDIDVDYLVGEFNDSSPLS